MCVCVFVGIWTSRDLFKEAGLLITYQLLRTGLWCVCVCVRELFVEFCIVLNSAMTFTGESYNNKY